MGAIETRRTTEAPPPTPPEKSSRFERLLTALVDRPGRVLIAIVVATVLLVGAGIARISDEEASFDPGGQEFDTAELVARTFRASTTELDFIVEDENADALDLATLSEWKRNSDELRASDELSPALSTHFDSDLGLTVTGFYTIADAVDDQLREAGVADGLAGATEAEVKIALATVLDEEQPTAILRDTLSVSTTTEEQTVDGAGVTVWASPAFLASIRVDHSAFPVDLESDSDPATRTDAQQQAIDSERDLDIEEWGRDALSTLRGDEEELGVWGIAIDSGLTSDDSFNATLPYLFAAFAVIVLLVGGLLRSYWAAALTGVGIAVTLLWARLLIFAVGFDKSILINVIIPIATISFGVDFLIHAVGRVREALAVSSVHRAAYVVGISGVVGALGLALSTSAIALASNATSQIQAITEFGFGAAIALGVAFVVLGILAPLFLLRIEEVVSAAPAREPTTARRALGWARLVLAAVLAGLVILAIIAAPFAGIMSTVVYGLLVIALPLWLVRRRARGAAPGARTAALNVAGESSALAGRVITGIVRRRWAMLALVALLTAIAAVGATQVNRKTEPQDFFPSNSDFVVGIEKLIAHTSTASPGDVYVYLEGDIADPAILAAAETAKEEVSQQGGDLFARNPDGTLTSADSAVDVARAVVGVEYARAAVAEASGVEITDEDEDGLPDTAEQVAAAYAYATENGVPADDSTFVYTQDQVARLLQPVDGGGYATVLRYPVQGFLSTSKVDEARQTVESSADEITAAAESQGRVAEARVSGEVVAEQVALDAITRAMILSVPLAMLLCFGVAALAMRSVRLAAVSVIPIALVIVWLLGFMAAFDYSINVVTATIAAVSVGVGIDFSIHYTMRYREQLGTSSSRLDGVRAAAEGTGTALVLSGLTSIVGFGVLALAPMPIFAAYGLL
ncbi:MAG TPA: MMPL family transporter, partial [Gaiellaceae bacterium]|nr:MMPL family transporter [Gaiellaceae bacterium]